MRFLWVWEPQHPVIALWLQSRGHNGRMIDQINPIVASPNRVKNAGARQRHEGTSLSDSPLREVVCDRRPRKYGNAATAALNNARQAAVRSGWRGRDCNSAT